MTPRPPRRRSCLGRLLRGCAVLFLAAGAALTVALLALVAWMQAAPRTGGVEVRDVTGLVRIAPDRVVAPRTIEEVQALVAAHDGPISIGGGRFSMGGQIGTDGALFLDMRGLDRIVSLDPAARRVVVEAGATWRDVIEAADPHDLSVKIMQSYADFTVGGTLSVNAHGRYVGEGPVVGSVRSIELVLADGRRVRASRTENPDLFHGAIGGYGALGVIVTAELELVPNTRVERRAERMAVDAFRPWFDANIRGRSEPVFFNADLYPPDYDDLVAITYAETNRPVTVRARVRPPARSGPVDHLLQWWVSEAPGGKRARADLLDPARLASQPVVWRNHEASYSVAELEPPSRERHTWVLQEYFVPVDRFDDFVPRLREIFRRWDVNVANVSIRHVAPDPHTLLTWAPVESFAFVVYYKQSTDPAEQERVGEWTRELVDAALACDGRWYLPYQILATDAQFHRGYPRARELFALKRRVDPDYTFRNRLLERYLPPSPGYGAPPVDEAAVRERLAARPTWARPEEQTFLTVPEWSVVHLTDELGAFLAEHPASEFPWFRAIGRYWSVYRAMWGATRHRYPTNVPYHAMLAVVGASFTAEFAAKGLWEGTIGRALAGDRVVEDDLYAEFTADLGAFTHHTPWYAYPFGARRAEMLSAGGRATPRRMERRLAGVLDLMAKQAWAAVVSRATAAAYAPEAEVVEAWIRPGGRDPSGVPGVTVLEPLGGGDLLVSLPRYEPFTAAVLELARQGVEFVEVAGGRRIVVQVRVPATHIGLRAWGDVLYDRPMLTDPDTRRALLEIPVRRLDEALPGLEASGAVVEHVHDY